MGFSLTRRHLLQTLSATTIPLSGCLGPERISLRIKNKRDQTQSLSVEFTETDSGDVLFSQNVEIESGVTREFEVGPIESRLSYTISYEMEGEQGESPVSGSGLQGVNVVIAEEGGVQIRPIVS